MWPNKIELTKYRNQVSMAEGPDADWRFHVLPQFGEISQTLSGFDPKHLDGELFAFLRRWRTQHARHFRERRQNAGAGNGRGILRHLPALLLGCA